ncbi:MAG TPA: VCBS repeat-containing protein, partial [Chthonomonadales bacterium]|nr:VCBS repeat-containing protein [Chthonomonadales bacterium]
MHVSDWNLAREQGWNIAERNDNRGAIVVQGTTLLLADSQGEKNRLAEVSCAHPLEVPERFAITLKLRLLKIGHEDDTTGEKCSFRMIIGARSPHGNYGLNFLFLGDRYKVDKLFKIFRTDDQWHIWRFEVDTARKTVAMFRDGAYVCLHEAGEAQKPGIRFQLQGSPDVPGRVEIADFRIEPVPTSPQRKRAVKHPPAQSVEAGEWPLWRRDVHNTALTPLFGKIKQPRIAWAVPAGATAPRPAFFDLDGDGRKEVLISHGGTLTAYTVSSERLWSRWLENAILHGVYDLDGDDERELLISSGFPSQLQILRARDGTTRYTCPLYPMAGVGGVRVARLDPKKKRLQVVVWSSQHEKGFCLSFEGGIEKAKVDWIFDWKMTNFTPAVALADMNRDGVLDVVVCTYDHTFVFDGRSGKLMMKLAWHSGRNYGTMVVRDIDGDGYPDVVMLADILREHIGVIKNEGGKALRLLWDRFYEQNYPEDHKSLRVLAESVDDFDGDGKIEVVYSLYDEKADAQWHTLIVDAVSGKVKVDLPGVAVAGAGPLFAGKPPVLILCKPSGRYDLRLDHLTLWAGKGGRWTAFAALPNGSLLGLTSPRDYPLSIGTTSGTNTSVLRRFGLWEEPGLLLARAATGDIASRVEFLVGEKDSRLATRWSGAIPRELIAGSAGFLEGSR